MKALLIFFVSIFLSVITMAQGWSVFAPEHFPSARVDDVFFFDENYGFWCTGSGQIFRTTDGLTAEQVYFPAEYFYFRSIEFLTEDIGFAGSLDNFIVRTDDGGDSWSEVDLGFDAPGICGMHAIDENTMWMSGAFFEPAYLIKTVDGGETWTMIDMSEQALALVDIYFIDENVGFVTGNNASGSMVLKTIDGGETWTEMYNNNVPGSFMWKVDQLHDNDDFIYCSIEIFSGAHPDLIISTDQGDTWVEKDPPNLDHQAIGFVSEQRGWISGHQGEAFETNDGGDTWIVDDSVTVGLNRIKFLGDNVGYAGGTFRMFKYTDSPTGISDLPLTTSIDPIIEVYPNPVNSDLNYSIEVTQPDNLRLFLFDVDGKLVQDLSRSRLKIGRNDFKFNINLPTGQYLLISHINSGTITNKINVTGSN